MTVERAQSGWPMTALVAVPLLGVTDAVGPQPLAGLAFAVNLIVLGVAGGRVLLGRTGLSAVERAAVALALPIGVLVLGTLAAAALGLRLDRPLWAALVALAAEAAAFGALSGRGHPAEPGRPRPRRATLPTGGSKVVWGGSLAAAAAVLTAAVTLSVWTAARQAYPPFSALSAIRVGSTGPSVRIELTSKETTPTRFIIAVSVGGARPEAITLRLAPGITWRKTVRAAGPEAVTVVAYRAARPRTPYREVHLAPRGSG